MPTSNYPKNLLPFDGEMFVLDNFLDTPAKTKLFSFLSLSTDWKQYPIKIFGKSYLQPREIAFYSDDGVCYTYSKDTSLEGLKWPIEILSIKKQIEGLTGEVFNSVLCNHYRDGNDSMGLHADNENSLGLNPFIASLSLGAERTFVCRHAASKTTIKVLLKDNSLVLMGAAMQHHWKHEIPKSKKSLQSRYNLTFRQIKKEA